MTKRIVIVTDETNPRIAALLAAETNVAVVTIDAETKKTAEENNVDLDKVVIDLLDVFPDMTGDELSLVVSNQVVNNAFDNACEVSRNEIILTEGFTPSDYNHVVDELTNYRLNFEAITEKKLALRDELPTGSKKPAFLLERDHRITKVRR